jgi:competence protein ComEA
MPDRDPRRLAAWAAAALVLILLTAWYLTRSRPSASASAPSVPTIAMAGQSESAGRLIIDVAGAVHRPGVYRMAQGARVEDALKLSRIHI